MAESIVDRVMDRELAGGEFKRQQSRFRDWVGLDPRTGEPGGFRAAEAFKRVDDL